MAEVAEDKSISDGEENVIGKNIRWIRESLKIRQTEMVARLQVYHVSITREALVKIEGGRQHIKLSQLRGLCKVLGVTYEDILDKPGEELLRELERRRREELAEKKKRKKRNSGKTKELNQKSPV